MFEPEKIDTLEFYRGIFEFFSLIFLTEPDEAILDKVLAGDAFLHWPVDSEKPELKQALDLLNSYCDSWESKQLEDLKFDYARLFLGLEKTFAPPYESVFLSEDHLLFDKETLQVRAGYEKFGLDSNI